MRRRAAVEALSDLETDEARRLGAQFDAGIDAKIDAKIDGGVDAGVANDTGGEVRGRRPAGARPAGNGAKDRQFVNSLARGLEVLRAFREGDGPLGNQDIARRTGLPKPTVSRLTYTLTRLGYLAYSARLGKYRIGTAAVSLGRTALANMAVRQIAKPHMQALADFANGVVALGTRDRLDMIYIEQCHGEAGVTLRLDVGSRIPIANTAMGRAFMAALPGPERDYLMDFLRKRHRHRWPAVERGIERARREIEDKGFCISLGEWQPDINAVAVPLEAPDGTDLMAINCGGPAFLVDGERLQYEIGPRLVNVMRNIQAALAGR